MDPYPPPIDPTKPEPAAPLYIDPVTGQQLYADPVTGALTYPGSPSPAPTGLPAPAYPGYGYPTYQYGGYGAPMVGGYPPPPQTNGLAIGSMVVSISALVLSWCYGIGGLIGLVGAILGHVSLRQIRTRGEGGRGMAIAGVVMGWIALAVALVVVGLLVWAVIQFSNNSVDYSTD
jgi:Domain of unknown function (DUF4190)